jgi:hypothetical protein
MADMTLEQVRDELRKAVGDDLPMQFCGVPTVYADILKWADAIDSALKAQGEPVAWMATCMGPIYAREVFRTRKEAEECCDAWDHCHVTPLYAAPSVDAALKAQGDTWYGHKFKEVADGKWRCECGIKLHTAPPTDDRPTWEEVRRLLARAWSECRYRSDHHETHNSYNEADRIIAEFRKK